MLIGTNDLPASQANGYIAVLLENVCRTIEQAQNAACSNEDHDKLDKLWDEASKLGLEFLANSNYKAIQ